MRCYALVKFYYINSQSQTPVWLTSRLNMVRVISPSKYKMPGSERPDILLFLPLRKILCDFCLELFS